MAVAVLHKIGEYHEQGVQDEIEYDYYPAWYLVRLVRSGIAH